MAKGPEKRADNATCSIGVAFENFGQSRLRRSKTFGELRSSHFGSDDPLFIYLVVRTLLYKSGCERIDNDEGGGRQLVPSLKVREQCRM